MNAMTISMLAIECDIAGRILEAQNHYEKSIQILLDLMQDEVDLAKKKVVSDRIKEYIDRVEQTKQRVNNPISPGELLASIPIGEDSTGNSYQSLFGKYLNAQVEEVYLDEPHFGQKFQFRNLILFLELIVKKCCNLKFILLATKPPAEDVLNMVYQIKGDLRKRNILMEIKYQDTLHDRKIVLSSGYKIKIGLDLHFYKACNPQYSLGLIDYDFRKCKQTEVDIMRIKYC